jgi:hypothetical protein
MAATHATLVQIQSACPDFSSVVVASLAWNQVVQVRFLLP